MSMIGGKGSRAERMVRRLVHGMGYRFRLHRRDLPGTPDLIFPSRGRAVFVHGCFWHRHGDPECKLARLPKSRLDFWLPKLEGNRERDVRQIAALNEAGWKTMIVWECELRDMEQVKNNLASFLQGDRA